MASNCPICLEDFEDKIRASPNTCDHIFCLPCLEKWSKLGSFCPVDRKRYTKILNLDSEDLIQVKPRKRRRTRTVYDFTTKCEVCTKDNCADILLLCDCCDLAFHLYCLSPPLKNVPSGIWFCPTCVAVEEKIKKKNGITKEIEASGCIENELNKGIAFNLRPRSAKKVELQENLWEDININRNHKSKYNLRGRTAELDEHTYEMPKLSKESGISKNSHENDSSSLEACCNIITEIDNIDIRRNCNKKINSSNLGKSCNELDKIYKTFDFMQNSSHETIKYSKTYNFQKRKKEKDVLNASNQGQMSTVLNDKCNSITDDMLLKNNAPEDANVLELQFSDSVHFDYMLPELINEDKVCETEVPKCNINEEKSQSCLNVTQSDTQKTFPISTTYCKKDSHKENERTTVNESNAKECLTTEHSPIGVKIQRNPNHMVTATDADSLLSHESSSKELLKEFCKRVQRK